MWLTNDNPRTEAPDVIARDILKGFSEPGCVKIELDRKQAIYSAVKHALPGDIVLIAGKGHETYQDVNGVKRYFSDLAVVLELMEVIH